MLLLFTDASRTDLQVLQNIRNLPARLLSTGMLLTILLGALAALVVFPQLSLWEAGISAAILAPTDAGLGQVIVNSPRVPMRIRQALNVEAGLNDGLSVPFLLFFIALAAGGTKAPGAAWPASSWSNLASACSSVRHRPGRRLAPGVAAGGVDHGIASRSSAWSRCRCCVWWRPRPLGASMFIAAFVAGLAVQVGFKEAGKHSVEFAEEWGQMFNLAVFFLFGMLARALAAIQPRRVAVRRPEPDGGADAAGGHRTDRHAAEPRDGAVHGWFGPRGLASIVLGLVYLEQRSRTCRVTTIRLAVMVTVLVSIFAHG